jgi:hypothetical protein
VHAVDQSRRGESPEGPTTGGSQCAAAELEDPEALPDEPEPDVPEEEELDEVAAGADFVESEELDEELVELVESEEVLAAAELSPDDFDEPDDLPSDRASFR